MTKAINETNERANYVELSTDQEGTGARDRLRFWLLRFTGLETPIWFEHFCCGLLSPNCEPSPYWTLLVSHAFLLIFTCQSMLFGIAILRYDPK